MYLDSWLEVVVFWGASGLLLGSILLLLPFLLLWLHPHRIHARFEEPPFPPAPSVAARLRELQALGFANLGTKVEILPLWGGKIQELALAAPAAQTFASLVLEQEAVSCYFYTPFVTGEFILTTTNPTSGFGPVEGEQLVVQCVPEATLEEAFTQHQRVLQAFTRRGLNPFRRYDAGARLEATALFYQSAYARYLIRQQTGKVSKHGIMFCLFLLLVIGLISSK